MTEEIRRAIAWDEVWLIERDICYLYYELSEFPTVDADRAFTLLYRLPYWEYLTGDLPETKRVFLQQGCLVMIFTMALDLLEGSGSYLKDKLDLCWHGLQGFVAANNDDRKLDRKSVV